MKHHSFLLAVLCTLGLTANAAVGDTFDVSYTSGSNSYSVRYEVSGTSPATVRTIQRPNYGLSLPSSLVVEIPQTVSHDGVQYTLTEVGYGSFYGWAGASITLPNTVTSIGGSAFYDSDFQSISIGTGVASIGDKAFYSTNITEIALPEGVTLLGNNCFQDCASLASASLPSTLTTVPQWCFYNCPNLTDITLASGIQNLGTQCFYGCIGLTNVTIPASVTSFGNQSKAFAGCSDIRKVTLQWTEIPPAFISQFPFEDVVKQNAEFSVPAGYEQAYIEALGIPTDHINPPLLGRIFTVEVSGQDVTFKVISEAPNCCQVGDGTNAAVDATFTGSLAMPASVEYEGQTFDVTEVAAKAFENCQLTGFSFGNITKVGEQAFKNSGLTSLDLASVTTIGHEAFYGGKFTSVNLSGVYIVGIRAFAHGSLTSVRFTSGGGGGGILSTRRKAPGSGNGPSFIGDGSFSENSIGEVSFSGSSISNVPNDAFSHNSISSLDLGDVESVGDYSFYDNDLTKLNTKNVKRMGKEAFGNNHFEELEFGTGSERSTDFTDSPSADNPFGDVGGLGSITAGGASLAAMEYFFGSYGAEFAAGIAITATIDGVWKYLMGKRKKKDKDDGGDDGGDDGDDDPDPDHTPDPDDPDRMAFGFADSPAPDETCLEETLPYNLQNPFGTEVSFETVNCTIDETDSLIIAGSQPGQASVTAKFRNKEGYHYDEKDITISFNVSDTDDCDPDKDKVPTMTILDRDVTIPRFATYNIRVKYENMTKEEASTVKFALKANPPGDSFLDKGILNYMKVEKKEDTDGTVNGGWPYVQVKTSWSPESMKNLLGFARYLTATLDVQRYRQYHLKDSTVVMALETQNPNIVLYADTIQVGDVITLPRFCDFFPICWALTPLDIPESDKASIAGYQRHSRAERMYDDGPIFHRGVPKISYTNENGEPDVNVAGSQHASIHYSRSWVPLGEEGPASTRTELMVDTVFVKGNSVGTSFIRFADPYWPNIYFNISVTCVEPNTAAPDTNPVEWDFTQPLTDELKEYGLRESTLGKSTAPYWSKREASSGDYYSADMGYYGLRYDSSDRKWAPFFMNNGENMPWFEGIEQSVLTEPEDDEHTTPSNKQWHTAKDHIRIFAERGEGEPQVAFLGQTDLRIKRPISLLTGEHKNYVLFKVKAKPLNTANPLSSITCSYTYIDETNTQQTYSQTVTPTTESQDFEFKLYGTVGQYINLSLCDVELSSIVIDAPITFAEQPQVIPTYEDGVYKNGTASTYYLGTDGKFYLKGSGDETYTEVSEEELFSVPYFTFRQHDGDLVKLEKYNSQDTEVIVPETVPDNYPDASLRGKRFNVIAGGAFADCTWITKVTIGDNVNHIGVDQGKGAFYGCNSLQELIVGSALDYLPVNCLNGCALTTFTTTSTREGDFYGLLNHAETSLTVRCYHTTPIARFVFECIAEGDDYYTFNFLDETVKHTFDDNGVCYYCGATVTLLANDADNTEVIADKDNSNASVVLQRRTLYQDGDWNTICLPFDLTISGSELDGAEARSLTDASLADGTLTLTFSEPVETLQHGVPYIIKWEEGDHIVEPIFQDVFLQSGLQPAEVADVITFQGIYSPLVVGEEGNNTMLYLGAGNTLYYPKSDFWMGAFRAYFQLADGITCGDPDSAVKGFMMDFSDDATSIKQIVNSKLSNSKSLDSWYSIDGMKHHERPARKGLYIRGGRKVVVK